MNSEISIITLSINSLKHMKKGAAKHMKQKLTEMKEEIEKSIITVGDFNIPLLKVSRNSRKKCQEGFKRIKQYPAKEI